MKSPCTGMTGPRFPYRRQTNEMVDLGKPSNRTYVVSWMSKFSTRMCKLVSSISTAWLVQRISQLPVCSLKWSPNDSVGNHFKILCVIGLGPKSLHDSGSSEGVSLSVSQVNFEKGSGTFHRQISVSCTVQDGDNVTTPHYPVSLKWLPTYFHFSKESGIFCKVAVFFHATDIFLSFLLVISCPRNCAKLFVLRTKLRQVGDQNSLSFVYLALMFFCN